MTVKIGLFNPKSPTNVGSVMRAAGCFSADEVYYTGERFDRAAKFHTDTQNSHETISLIHLDDFVAFQASETKIICVELIEGAIPLTEFQHPNNAIYLFGPEDGSIDKKTIENADSLVYLPTNGSLNLAATVNIVLYDRLAKSDNIIANDELIRKSQGKNNRTKRRTGVKNKSSQ